MKETIYFLILIDEKDNRWRLTSTYRTLADVKHDAKIFQNKGFKVSILKETYTRKTTQTVVYSTLNK